MARRFSLFEWSVDCGNWQAAEGSNTTGKSLSRIEDGRQLMNLDLVTVRISGGGQDKV